MGGGLSYVAPPTVADFMQSSAFVRARDYGTRCSTIIRIDARGRAYFEEWSWNSEGADAGRISLQFELG